MNISATQLEVAAGHLAGLDEGRGAASGGKAGCKIELRQGSVVLWVLWCRAAGGLVPRGLLL